MRRLLAAPALLLFVLACSDTPDSGVCDEFTQVTCAKSDECGIQDESQCLMNLEGECAANNGCPASQTFDPDAAESCIDQILAADCDDVVDDTADLSSCDVVCI